jgi:hypothetical protein
MMKKVLTLLLVLVMAFVANAGLLDLQITSHGDGTVPRETVPVEPTKEITINPSDWLDLDIFYTGTEGWLLASICVDLVVTGGGSIYIDELTEPEDAWDGDLTVLTEVVAGKHYQLEFSLDDGVLGTGLPVIALDHILFHCDTPGDVVTITMTDNPSLGTGGTVETDFSDMVTPSFGGPVTITQTPEPMTVALLGLGGLFLRRRK